MIRSFALAAVLSLTFVCAGCFEAETDLTLNADGSGTMKQKVNLTPTAHVVLKQIARQFGREPEAQMQTYLPILSEESLKRWQERNPESGIEVVRFQSSSTPEGALTGEVELKFKDLKRFAESDWGFPLQLSVQKTEQGLTLSAEEPLRGVVSRAARGEIREVFMPAPPEKKADDEYLGGRDAASRLMKDARSRVTIHLPAAAAGVENGELSAGGNDAVCDMRLAPNAQNADAWMLGKPLAVRLPAGALKVAPFAAPERAVRGKPLPPPEVVAAQDGFTFTLDNVSHYITTTALADSRRREERWQMNIACTIPDGLKFTEHFARGDVVITALRDQTGKEFPDKPQQTDFSIPPGPRGGTYGKFAARMNITMQNVPAGATAISLLEGSVMLRTVGQENAIKLALLGDKLNVAQPMGNQTLTFTAIKGNEVVVLLKDPDNPRPRLADAAKLAWRDAAGKEIASRGHGARTADNATEYTFNLGQPFPADGSVEITFPGAIKMIKIPFRLTDIPLPE